MHILISNDDGYRAPGLRCLADALQAVAEVTVVAPDRDRSGASNSLTLDSPLRAREAENGYTCVEGTPTDCVHLAITGLLEQEPDMVVSGINAGANLGDDVIYSGTVAAAMEGRFLGFPAIAVSLVSTRMAHFDTAARIILTLLDRLKCEPVPPETILNVNVPDLPFEELQGWQVTRLGHRHKSEPVIRETDPRGRPMYWVGPAGSEQDAGPGTDFHAVRNGFVSVTPIHVDLTRYDVLDQVRACLGESIGA
ncbi:MAG TPA: 5'/3'-nucleotidase SurE [Gammaproteobacteria bacterium]|nr:5'/3'-nucleotidase SurE [Gammaproteobacteria bacterium]